MVFDNLEPRDRERAEQARTQRIEREHWPSRGKPEESENPQAETIEGISPNDLFRKGDRIYEVVRIIDKPTLFLRDTSWSNNVAEIAVVIGSAQHKEFKHFVIKEQE